MEDGKGMKVEKVRKKNRVLESKEWHQNQMVAFRWDGRREICLDGCGGKRGGTKFIYNYLQFGPFKLSIFHNDPILLSPTFHPPFTFTLFRSKVDHNK